MADISEWRISCLWLTIIFNSVVTSNELRLKKIVILSAFNKDFR